VSPPNRISFLGTWKNNSQFPGKQLPNWDWCARWPVCAGLQSGRSRRPMVGMYQPSIREDSPSDDRYAPAINQGCLPAQWLVCAGLWSGKSPRPMAGMYRLLIREVFLPYGQYIPAINQGGLTARWPVCTVHQSGRPPYSSTRVWLYSCKGCTLVRAWALSIKEVGPTIKAVDLAWMAVQEHLWALWQFHAIIGQYWCSGKMANLAAQGHWMARLAVQNHIWPFRLASTTIIPVADVKMLRQIFGSPFPNSVMKFGSWQNNLENT
jgi:hypothetical protein